MTDRLNPDDLNRTEREQLARDPGASNLVRLDDLDNLEIADGEPDIRGWDVKTAADGKIGEVKSLIVNPTAMQVRYMEVKVDHNVLGTDDDQNVLVPISAARLDADNNTVFINRLPTAGLTGAPRYAGGPITASDEDLILVFYGTDTTVGDSGTSGTRGSYGRVQRHNSDGGSRS